LSKQAGVTLASGIVALALGLYATHTMVPPTPGPVAAAGVLGADLGLVILIGMIVAALALIPGWLFAVKVASKVMIDPDSVSQPAEASPVTSSAEAPGVAHATSPRVRA
jgi:gluconate:H+ symporter, GntP family